MKNKLSGVWAILLLGAVACSEKPKTHESHGAAHDNIAVHADHAATENTWAKPAKKFSADESLKVRMERILKTMKAMHAAEKKAPQKADRAKIGTEIEATVKDIFKNCKLEPAADAAIHPILGELLKGAGDLKKGESKSGHEIIHNALLRYEDFFEHPGWSH